MTKHRKQRRQRSLGTVAATLGLLALLVTLFVTWSAGWWSAELNQDRVAHLVASAGAWGPLAVIGLMTAAVVASPLPSAPIALAAGAAYGHYLGAVYVAFGSEMGAILAFLVARGGGRDRVERLLGGKTGRGLLRSQNALTLTVFVSRLLPFVSFDVMSYAAGLSRLHFWRFALATLAGILPTSFILAHFGSAAMAGDFGTAEWLFLALGLLTAAPLVLLALRGGKSTKRQPNRRPQKEGNTG
ncbi:TVP38/TMEM64 family protein [Phaeobacter gallaeciensis]|uniref:TVP38/TMEM64 family protein n=1 Tax=Phaeobacter gallaeciensis TaxID=60890 RepID=UPI00237FAE22|nr:TVP38/TMEM64 family protein [Phaeobacter gallaeciensis]MDE4099912.1 TVP38/TMEM64 family protein [Phaeobacter gallaeciensis]MDE4117609.1 TVP38/TMEM64 family protein [Phaeobacter gallaeciensis]MDE4122106.1 TVP38/TMEM64 family protein [Phaeobacter gallaeciensis]